MHSRAGEPGGTDANGLSVAPVAKCFPQEEQPGGRRDEQGRKGKDQSEEPGGGEEPSTVSRVAVGESRDEAKRNESIG